MLSKTPHSKPRHLSLLGLALVSTVAWPPAAAASPASTPPGPPDASAAAAPGPPWVQATPFGGSILSLAQAPSSPRTLYAAALRESIPKWDK